jgi:homoserine acetyltransferase
MKLWNSLWRIADALSYMLILYMMYKFLVPAEQVNVIAETTWLKEINTNSDRSETSSSRGLKDFKMPVFMSAINQDALMDTLTKHFNSHDKEEREVIL